ncbi:MAG: iron-sulfur cluster carrier protein ApbC [Coxiellaceae bacterium]|nr:iron-sulfur cluster carrier protein ApbC [Coxiellaceae bacterium]
MSTPFSIPGIKKIIAIASGKGGVGKSTTTVNLALALSKLGKRVGILDADIYGPNQPHMLGGAEKPELIDNERFKPIERFGLQTMSMGYLVDSEEPMVWRGPMVVKALHQMLYFTAWDNLDYLLIDLPPGTGDVQLTLSQKTPLNGVIIVSTPQTIALLDARKGLEMFRKVNVPIIGVIENMSEYICPHCHHSENIFGKDGAENMALEYEVALLGKIPLDLKIREQADAGNPIVIAEPDSVIAKAYEKIAELLP